MAARKKTTRKSTTKKSTKKSTKKKSTRKQPAKKAASNSIEATAKRILAATFDPRKFVIADLYTTDCVSQEAGGDAQHGHAGIEAKGKQWEQMQKGTKWTARNVFVRGNTICIEWDCRVTLNDGRTVGMPEVAVHEIRGGKIARERYYYNPTALMPS